MSFPRYPAYKPSGVEWLGEVPEHWEALRLRFVVALNPSKQEAKEFGDHEVVSFLPMEAIGEDGSLRLEHEKQVAECLSGYTYFRDGDVCIAKITPCFENGKGAILCKLKGGIGFGTTELIVARPEEAKITKEFLDYLFRSQNFRRLGESEMYGAGGQKRVPDSFVRDFTAALPSIEEQNKVTTFLDRETAKIDALIAEQQHLIELLQEKRQAMISHAVTKGLNPDAPMKDSGVEWLGEVPEHWEVKQVRHLLKSLTQGSSPNCLPEPAQGDEYGVLKVGCVNGIAFLPTENKALPPESQPDLSSLIQQGDVLMSRGNTRELVGLAALVTEASDRLMASDLIFILRVLPEIVNQGFLAFSLRSVHARSQLEPKTVGTSASMQKINQSTIKEVFLPIPPLTEQTLILVNIQEEVQYAGESVENSREAISLLQERRSALISAAVTGQIDVRGMLPEAEAA